MRTQGHVRGTGSPELGADKGRIARNYGVFSEYMVDRVTTTQHRFTGYPSRFLVHRHTFLFEESATKISSRRCADGGPA